MFKVYLLSIMESFSILLGLLFVFAAGIAVWAAIEFFKTEDEEHAKTAKFWMYVGWILTIFFLYASALIPTKKDLIESYVIVKGKQVVESQKTGAVVDSLTGILQSLPHVFNKKEK